MSIAQRVVVTVTVSGSLLGLLAPVAAWSTPVADRIQPTHRSGFPNYRLTTMPPPAGDRAFGASITNTGLVAGTASREDGTTYAVQWRTGQEPLEIDPLGGDGASSASLWPVKNNAGAVVGITQTDAPDPNDESWSCSAFLPARPGYACVGFVHRDGITTPLPTLGGTHGFATGINNRGQIVGWAETTYKDPTCTDDQVLQFLAVRWDEYGDRTTVLPPLAPDSASAATAINDRGTVVGISGDCGFAVGGFSARNPVVWDHGAPRPLPDLGGVAWDTPMSLNRAGDIVGFLNRSEADGIAFRPLPVWWTRHGTLRPLDLPAGYDFGQALGINARRQITGVAFPARADGRPDFTQGIAVLWHHEAVQVLEDLAPDDRYTLVSANDINDRGQITGEALDTHTGKYVAFVATQ
jgi:uncharacterized membrane protein